MVTITLDNQKITVPEGTTIMEAASQNGIPIPHLCYLKGINEIAACRVHADIKAVLRRTVGHLAERRDLAVLCGKKTAGDCSVRHGYQVCVIN